MLGIAISGLILLLPIIGSMVFELRQKQKMKKFWKECAEERRRRGFEP